jgi:hypothetical protein
MTIKRDLFSQITTFLAADVPNAGTFTVPYPNGLNQQDFDTNLGLTTGGYALVNLNDKWTGAAGKVSFAFGASLITVTNSSGVTWTANSRIDLQIDRQDGNVISYIQIPLNLASIANGVVFGALGLRPGIVGTLEYYEALVQTAATTAAKLATIVPQIDGVSVTGGALALTSANATPANIILPAPLITGANALLAHSKLNFLASGVTAFVEGVIMLNLRIRHANEYQF